MRKQVCFVSTNDVSPWPKLVVWDLDETILEGIFEEGERDVDPRARELMAKLDARGILQCLATQNPPEVLEQLQQSYDWFHRFVLAEASFSSKSRKVRRALEELDVHVSGVAFVDEDPFERDSIEAQIPGLRSLGLDGLLAAIDGSGPVTPEGQARPQMYKDQKQREQAADGIDYEAFLRKCDIRMTIRSYEPGDRTRVEELLTRTHRMNLGFRSLEDTMTRLAARETDTLVAELEDSYGNMGRCGVVQLGPLEDGVRTIESLAISCRTRARGLALAMAISLLRCGSSQGLGYRCKYRPTERNRPLRMLLLAAGFKKEPESGWFRLAPDRLAKLEIPDWVQVEELLGPVGS